MTFFSQREENNEYALLAKTDNAKNVLHLLKAISFKENALVLASNNGLRVTVEDAKCSQANAFIQADMFQEYHVSEEMVTFKLNLSILVECLSIFGGCSSPGVTPTLKLCYSGYGSPLLLLMEEAGVVTECKINTMEPEDSLDFNFSNDNVINKVVVRSEGLKEIFSELDRTSTQLEIMLSPQSPHIRLSTFGNYGTNHTDVPKDSELIESFKCTSSTSHRYRLSLLRPCIKALTASKKTSIRVDNRGFLCLQFLIQTEDHHVAFVEFFCCPEEDNNE